MQFFLEDRPMSVAEVAAARILNPRTGHMVMILRCTCARWNPIEGCRHTAVVSARIFRQGGTYSHYLDQDIDEPTTVEEFRQMLVEHSVIEVLGAER